MFVLFFYAQLLKLGEYIWASSIQIKLRKLASKQKQAMGIN